MCNINLGVCNILSLPNSHLCIISKASNEGLIWMDHAILVFKTIKMKIVSFIIIMVGVILIAYHRFSFSSSEKMAEIGNVQMMKHKNQNIQWPPIAGLALVVGGILMVTVPKKNI